MRKIIAFVLLTLLTLSGPAAAADKIGFIYVGPAADYGYNMSMDLGRLYVEKNVKDVTTSTFEQVPESAEVERVMERLVNSGHTIIFATSYGYLDHAIRVGQRYPKVAFLHAGGLKTSANVGTYWADSDDGMYLAGDGGRRREQDGQAGLRGRVSDPAALP